VKYINTKETHTYRNRQIFHVPATHKFYHRYIKKKEGSKKLMK
jgi:hypothetical protein